MHQLIFISLPVADLDRAKAFYAALGYALDPKFSGEHAASVILSEGRIQVMLSRPEFFSTLTNKTIVDAHTATGSLLSLTCESQEEVDALVARALAAGGTTPHPPEDYGFMYSWGFIDPDGHGWGLNFMRGTPD